MRTGALDFAHGVFTSVGADDAIFEGMDLAGLAPDIATSRKISDAFKPIIDENFRQKHGIKLLAMVPFPSQVFFCRQPINAARRPQGKEGSRVRPQPRRPRHGGGRDLRHHSVRRGGSRAADRRRRLRDHRQPVGNSAKWAEVDVPSLRPSGGLGDELLRGQCGALECSWMPACASCWRPRSRRSRISIWEFTAKEDQDALQLQRRQGPLRIRRQGRDDRGAAGAGRRSRAEAHHARDRRAALGGAVRRCLRRAMEQDRRRRLSASPPRRSRERNASPDRCRNGFCGLSSTAAHGRSLVRRRAAARSLRSSSASTSSCARSSR